MKSRGYGFGTVPETVLYGLLLVFYRSIVDKTATPFKNSVVIGHWHKNAKVTAIKQQKSK
jgi:hypothetical protein